MVILALWQIFTRYILKNPASFTTEFLRYALLWLALLAAAYCFGKKAHLAIVFLKEKFSGKLLLIINIFIELTIIIFAIYVLFYVCTHGVILTNAELNTNLYLP